MQQNLCVYNIFQPENAETIKHVDNQQYYKSFPPDLDSFVQVSTRSGQIWTRPGQIWRTYFAHSQMLGFLSFLAWLPNRLKLDILVFLSFQFFPYPDMSRSGEVLKLERNWPDLDKNWRINAGSIQFCLTIPNPTPFLSGVLDQ